MDSLVCLTSSTKSTCLSFCTFNSSLRCSTKLASRCASCRCLVNSFRSASSLTCHFCVHLTCCLKSNLRELLAPLFQVCRALLPHFSFFTDLVLHLDFTSFPLRFQLFEYKLKRPDLICVGLTFPSLRSPDVEHTNFAARICLAGRANRRPAIPESAGELPTRPAAQRCAHARLSTAWQRCRTPSAAHGRGSPCAAAGLQGPGSQISAAAPQGNRGRRPRRGLGPRAWRPPRLRGTVGEHVGHDAIFFCPRRPFAAGGALRAASGTRGEGERGRVCGERGGERGNTPCGEPPGDAPPPASPARRADRGRLPSGRARGRSPAAGAVSGWLGATGSCTDAAGAMRRTRRCDEALRLVRGPDRTHFEHRQPSL